MEIRKRWKPTSIITTIIMHLSFLAPGTWPLAPAVARCRRFYVANWRAPCPNMALFPSLPA